ncbi:hypothetical protein ACFQ7B_40845 [Streptomyces erythrochromogenes]|uniref:hypothetical protein n=1 Tax=Streptomyces erythrochromogenes TaxID=285574 RepID=UPI0036BAE5D8
MTTPPTPTTPAGPATPAIEAYPTTPAIEAGPATPAIEAGPATPACPAAPPRPDHRRTGPFVTASRTPRPRPRTATARSLALALCLAAAALTAGCRDDTAPAWEYPRLAATLNSLSAALAQDCATPDPGQCAAGLDHLDTLARRAFTEVLDHRLLDQACLAAESEVRRARTLRLAATAQAQAQAQAQEQGQGQARRDPRHPALEQARRAVAAERAAYRRLLAALEKVRTTPPPGAQTQPL